MFDATHPSPLHLAAIALGSNLGDSPATFRAAMAQLRANPQICIQTCSQWYHTPAVGPPQPDYLNGCLLLHTALSPSVLLGELHRIEAQFGRVRHEHWGPRTLDLDLLLYEQQQIQTPDLTVPHPHLHERAFVLVPLCEILPDWVHPIYHQNVRQLTQAVDCTGVHPV